MRGQTGLTQFLPQPSESRAAPRCRPRISSYGMPCQAAFDPPGNPEVLSFIYPARLVRTYWYSNKYFVRLLFADWNPFFDP